LSFQLIDIPLFPGQAPPAELDCLPYLMVNLARAEEFAQLFSPFVALTCVKKHWNSPLIGYLLLGTVVRRKMQRRAIPRFHGDALALSQRQLGHVNVALCRCKLE